MFLNAHYQNAYVTRDLDVALALMKTEHGVDTSTFMSLQVEMPVMTPAGPGVQVNRLALGWVGKLQYELIQPISGAVEVYQRHLPEQYPMQFHHVCMRVENDWDAFREGLTRDGRSIVLEGSSGDQLKFVYVDARATLGHYLEYCWMTPTRWEQMGGR